MNELALFAGAGGGILGGHLLGWRTVCAVEWDAYAASVLVERQNDGLLEPFPLWDDVRTFDGRPWRGLVDVVSGGFPCQAYSSAARGANTAEDLWPEMCRVVAAVAPWCVFPENVAERAIDAAADDLRSLGYKTVAIALAAKDLGADHERVRYWLLAYAHSHRELLRAKYAEASLRACIPTGVWQAEPDGARMADGVAHRVERLAVTGNGQVPGVAAAAFLALAQAAIGDTSRMTPRPLAEGTITDTATEPGGEARDPAADEAGHTLSTEHGHIANREPE